MLDGIFGEANFRNEIIWKRTGRHTAPSDRGLSHERALLLQKSDQDDVDPDPGPLLPGVSSNRYNKFDDGIRAALPRRPHGRRTTHGAAGSPWRGIDPTDKGRPLGNTGFVDLVAGRKRSKPWMPSTPRVASTGQEQDRQGRSSSATSKTQGHPHGRRHGPHQPAEPRARPNGSATRPRNPRRCSSGSSWRAPTRVTSCSIRSADAARPSLPRNARAAMDRHRHQPDRHGDHARALCGPVGSSSHVPEAPPDRVELSNAQAVRVPELGHPAMQRHPLAPKTGDMGIDGYSVHRSGCPSRSSSPSASAATSSTTSRPRCGVRNTQRATWAPAQLAAAHTGNRLEPTKTVWTSVSFPSRKCSC